MHQLVRYGCLGIAGFAALGKVAQAAQATPGSELTGSDRTFAVMVAQTDLAEIQIGNLALQKSDNPQVKQIAQKLVQDHTKTSTALKQLASTKGLALPAETDSKHKTLAEKLQNESGKEFDQDFLLANSKDHHKVIQAFEKEASSGQDSDPKQFASEFLPAIKEHSGMIDQAQGQRASQ